MARTVTAWAPTRRRMNTCCWALLLFLRENRPEVRMIAVMTTPGNKQRNLEQTEQGLFLKLAYATWDKRLTSNITTKITKSICLQESRVSLSRKSRTKLRPSGRSRRHPRWRSLHLFLRYPACFVWRKLSRRVQWRRQQQRLRPSQKTYLAIRYKMETFEGEALLSTVRDRKLAQFFLRAIRDRDLIKR